MYCFHVTEGVCVGNTPVKEVVGTWIVEEVLNGDAVSENDHECHVLALLHWG